MKKNDARGGNDSFSEIITAIESVLPDTDTKTTAGCSPIIAGGLGPIPEAGFPEDQVATTPYEHGLDIKSGTFTGSDEDCRAVA